MESRFDYDFSRVRLRTAEPTLLGGASACAQGRELVFAPGFHAPGTPQGKLLLAHELAHIVQQGRSDDPKPEGILEAEAARAAEQVLHGERATVRGRAPYGRAQYQRTPAARPNWKTGSDVVLNPAAIADVKVRGGLFSGQDQAHVNVSAQGRLTYDQTYTIPEDSFRWQRLKDIVDTGHIEINAVSPSQQFTVREVSGKSSRVVQKSIDEIKLDVGDLSVTGITLVRLSVQGAIQAGEEKTAGVAPTPVSGPVSASSTRDQIYYDKDNLGALSHELFGHAWLALKGVPFLHPKAGTQQEKTMGTLSARHQIKDPFGQVYTGTVHEYIAKFIESHGEERKLPGGAKTTVPASPTEGVSQQQFRDALAGFITEAKTGLGKTTTAAGSRTFFTEKLAQQLRIVSNNFDALSDAGDRQLIVDFLADKWFKTKLNSGQQEAFRDMLDDFGKRKGWSNALASALEKKVGPSKASQMYQPGPAQFSPGGLQLTNP